MTTPPSQPAPGARTRIAGLDGLRAIAVVGVLLYHAEVEWAQGGFIGVDIFFVLSGYLVTSIVLANLARTGTLGFRRFWSARLRRLAPAQITMIVAITLAVAIGYRDELAGLRGQVIAAFTGTTNWYLIATEGSYFEQAGRPPLLRHLWSLAIELQFYLVFPLVLVAMMRHWRDRLDRIAIVLATAIVASAIYMAILFQPGADPTRVYFDTFARLSAPLVGALLAVLWRPRNLGRSAAANLGGRMTVLGGAGLVGLVWMLHVSGDRSAFMYRGGFLLAALLTGLVVAGLTHPSNQLGGRFGLGHPALVAIGLRSYGLYLWHWPIFMLTRPRIDVSWSWGTTFAVRMILTIGLTELCYRFVEQPWHERAPDASWAGIKRRLLQPSGVRTAPRLLALGSTIAIVLALVIVARPANTTNETTDSLVAGQAALDDSSNQAPVAPTTSVPTVQDPPDEGSGPTTTVAPEPGTGTATLVGDSVMVGAVPDLQAAFGERANINAEVSRQAADLPPVITQLGIEGRLGDTVVVQVGINGTVTDENLRDIVAAADGRRVLIVNARVPRSWEGSNNSLVAQLVPELENAAVVDWFAESDSHRDWFLDDGVHLTDEGRAAYASLLRRSVDS